MMEKDNDITPVIISTQSDQDDLQNFVKSLLQRRSQKLNLREKNAEAISSRLDESALRKLDSNLKKNIAFVKRIKTLTDNQKASILKDFESLNLSKYVAELAASVAEAKLKSSDVPTMVELCSNIHQRYSEFSQSLLDSYFKKTFPKRKGDQIQNLGKFRVDLRLLADLITVGVFGEKDALPVLGAALNYMVQNDKEIEHPFLPILSSFAKICGEDYASFVPSRYKELAERHNVDLPPKSPFFSEERQKVITNLYKDYFGKVNADLMSLYKEVKRLERRMQRQYDTKGEIHSELRQNYEESKASLTKLHASISMLADLIDQPLPQLSIDEKSIDDGLDEIQTAEDGGLIVGGLTSALSLDGGLWEDVETRTFYESLPELRSMLPGILFKESEKATLPPLIEKISEEDESAAGAYQSEAGGKTDDQLESATANQSVSLETIEETAYELDQDGTGNEEEEGDDAASTQDKTPSNVTLKQMMDVFVTQLPTLNNRDLIDRAAVDFVTNLNNKINRNRLFKAIFGVQRSRLDLLPFYARLVAILQPVMPDLATELVRMVISEFRRRLRKKDQIFIEEKIKVARFLGELVKFKLCPKSEALHCLKISLFDFRHHSIDMTCALLDSCGYFLYHSKDSHQRTKILIEQMLRKRQTASSNLDQRYQLMIDNAYFTCVPPESSSVARVERPPIQQYIRRLLFEDLGQDTVEKVLKQMRKLNWEDESIVAFVIESLSQPWMAKFSDVQWLASLLAGITWYYDFVGHRVVDNVLEDVRVGMEINHPKLNQRRLCCIKYVGEMYNYRVVDSTIVFHLLYSLITFGVSLDTKIPSSLDPPEHLFRIRLACVCLDTCGEYFDKGLSRKKLDIYLTYLQRYYWWKRQAACWNEDERPFPVEIENLLDDLIEFLRPEMRSFESFDEANKAVTAIEEEFRCKLEAALKSSAASFSPRDQETDEDEEKNVLQPMQDEDEEDYASVAARNSKLPKAAEISDYEKDDEEIEPYNVDDEMDQEVRVKLTDSSLDDASAYENTLFDAEFDKFLGECISNRTQEQLKVPQPEFSVPVISKAKKQTRFDAEEKIDTDEVQSESTKADNNVNFFVMVKGKGSKVALKSIKVPLDSDLARTLKDREIVEQEEKQRVKQLTLNMTRRMQEEELEEVERKQTMEKERIRQHQQVYTSLLSSKR